MTDTNPLKVVDISHINESTASDILNAATSQGFLFVEGHNFSQRQVDELFSLSQTFFSQPQSYKDQYPINESNRGYTGYGGENLDPEKQTKGDPKEAFNLAKLNLKTGEPILSDEYPEVPPIFATPQNSAIIKSINLKLYHTTLQILKLLAMGLKIDDYKDTSGNSVKGENWFSDRHTEISGTTLRFLIYPGQKSLNPEAVIRAGAHTDYGGLTLLFQRENQEGLEIFSPISKKWETVPYIKSQTSGEAPPIIVNIGDLLSYWTNGLLKSTIHRVKFPAKVQETGQDRYSIVFFSHPDDDTLLEPVPSDLTKEIVGRGADAADKVITAGEHLRKRLAATYYY